jgi:uncharacterized protein
VSIDKHIVTLERLVGIDAEIKELTDKMEKERAEIDGVKVELDALDKRIQGDKGSVAEMDKTRGDLVQELRQIGTQIERSRDRLGRARNEREVNAAERELDELRKIQRDRDDEIKKLNDLAGQARGTIGDNETRQRELAQRLEGSLAGSVQSIAGFEGQLGEQRKGREEIVRELPNRVYLRYQRLHERGKVPVAKTHDGTCLGCYVQLPPMMFHRMLSRVEFEECPNCHRIIYYEPPPSADEAEPRAEDQA